MVHFYLTQKLQARTQPTTTLKINRFPEQL